MIRIALRSLAAAAATLTLATAIMVPAGAQAAASDDTSTAAARASAAKAAAAVAAAGTSDITPMHWSCGRSAPPDLDTSGGHRTIVVADVRVGSSTRCAIAGRSFPSEYLDYHCYALDINLAVTWTYVVNVQTRVAGWIRDDMLNDGGSRIWCPGQTNLG